MEGCLRHRCQALSENEAVGDSRTPHAQQNVELALRLADCGHSMESGRAILTGPSAELLQSAEVKRIFLGDVAL